MSGIVGQNLGRGSGLVKKTAVAADSVTGASIADDAIDSEHYTDGSIDNAHIADDAIDSEHYADGSIDNAHIADDAIDSEHYAAGSIDTAHIADNQITLAKMAGGTDGNIISYDASGDPVAIATGSDGQVLTSTGAGSPPAFEAAAGGGDLSFGGDTFGSSRNIGATDNYDFGLLTNNNVRIYMDRWGKVFTGGETAANAVRGSMTLQSAAEDGVAFQLKSSDIAHPFTGISALEADSFVVWQKQGFTGGGLNFNITADADRVAAGTAWFECFVTNSPEDTKSGGGQGCFHFKISETNDSTSSTNVSTANGNLFSIADYTNTAFIFDKEGDFHVHSSSDNVYDEYDDAQLVRALDLSRGEGRGVIESKFDKFVAYNHEHLAEMKLVGREDDGTPNHMINVCGFQRLHNGAIWQQYEKHERLLEAVYELAKESVGEEKADAILEKHEVKRLQ